MPLLQDVMRAWCRNTWGRFEFTHGVRRGGRGWGSAWHTNSNTNTHSNNTHQHTRQNPHIAHQQHTQRTTHNTQPLTFLNWFHFFFLQTSLKKFYKYKYVYVFVRVIMNRHGRHNFRNGFVWVQTSHSTCTCTAAVCVIEVWTHQKFESFEKIPRRQQKSNSNLLINSKTLPPEIVRIYVWRNSTSQSRSWGKWVKTLCLPKSSRLFVVGSKEASWEEQAWEPPCNGISSSTKFYLNSCTHSGISEFNELPRSIVVSSGCPDRSSTEVDTCTGEMSLLFPSSLSRIWISLTVGEENEKEERW